MPVGYMHDFHFVMNKGLKEGLKGLEMFNQCKGLSGMIVKILSVLSPVIGREHRWGKERMGRYLPVCDDPDEIRENVHVYMPGDFYRGLKLLHQDLNVYSIAQLVRGFLVWFLRFAEGCEGDVLGELEKLFACWSEDEAQTRLTPREYLLQLVRIIQHLPGKNRLVNIYTREFSPFWILRI